MWMKCCFGEGHLLAVVIYCDWTMEKCGRGCVYIVGCCNISVGVKRRIVRGEDRSGGYLGRISLLLYIIVGHAISW